MAHRAPSGPGQRVEPVQRQQRLRGQVDQQIMPGVMGQFMRQREIARLGIVPGHEAQWQGHDLVEHAKGNRGCNRRAFHQPHFACFSHRQGISQQRAAHLHIGNGPPAKEQHRARQPEWQHEIAPCPSRGQRRHSGGLHVGYSLNQCHRRGRRAPAGRQRQWRQHQPQQRQQPQRIGSLRAKGPGNRAAQDQNGKNQQPGNDQGIGKPGHLRSAFSRASISLISASLSASVSARCANSGAARPPNSRSTSRLLSPPR